MRAFFLFFLFLLVQCNQQRPATSETSFSYDTTLVIALDLDSMRKQDIVLVNNYSDSLNQWLGGPLPKFLERDIESEHPNFSEDFHHLRSFRKEIFDRVNNQKVLRAIFDSENHSYLIPRKVSRQPYSALSIKELAKMRLDELERE